MRNKMLLKSLRGRQEPGNRGAAVPRTNFLEFVNTIQEQEKLPHSSLGHRAPSWSAQSGHLSPSHE